MAGSKPTAVHFALIFLVMVSLILGVFAYMYYKDYQEAAAQLSAAQDQANRDKAAIANGLQQIEDLKAVMGYVFTDVGTPGDQNENTVLGAARKDMARVAGLLTAAPQQQTLREVISALASTAQTKTTQTQTAQANEATSLSNFRAQTSQQELQVQQALDAQRKSEATLRDQQAKHSEAITALTRQVEHWQTEYRNALGQYETLRDEHAQALEDFSKQKRQLQLTIDFQRDQIAQLQDISFESPDGEIQYVDNTTRHVWINRGERDYLKPQVTFSVYTKEHRGIARSIADVKAKIEVVSVSERSAKCRILDEDLARPIAPGDPIYSPLWQAGLVEKFAFVGIIDLDGDGVSDREVLREIMDVNHAQIKLQILDDGTRVPAEGTLDVDTKFLVKGEIPDPTQFPGLDEKQRHIEAMMTELRHLEEDSKKYGVQVISLNEFLVYMGYKNQQRIYRPGQNQPYNLSAGAHSTSTDAVVTDRTSSGQVSGAITGRGAGLRRFGQESR